MSTARPPQQQQTHERRRSSQGFIYPTLESAQGAVFYDGTKFIPNNQVHAAQSFESESGLEESNRKRIELLQDQLAKKDGELLTAKNDSKQLRAAMSALEEKYSKMKQKYRAREAALNEAQASIAAAREQCRLIELELAQAKRQCAELLAQVEAAQSDRARAVEDAQDVRAALERFKLNERALQDELIAQRARAETLQRVVHDTHHPFEELLVKVVLPNSRRASFVVNAFSDDARAVAETFASQHRLGVEATRVLVAFTLAQCEETWF